MSRQQCGNAQFHTIRVVMSFFMNMMFFLLLFLYFAGRVVAETIRAAIIDETSTRNLQESSGGVIIIPVGLIVFVLVLIIVCCRHAARNHGNEGRYVGQETAPARPVAVKDKILVEENTESNSELPTTQAKASLSRLDAARLQAMIQMALKADNRYPPYVTNDEVELILKLYKSQSALIASNQFKTSDITAQDVKREVA